MNGTSFPVLSGSHVHPVTQSTHASHDPSTHASCDLVHTCFRDLSTAYWHVPVPHLSSGDGVLLDAGQTMVSNTDTRKAYKPNHKVE